MVTRQRRVTKTPETREIMVVLLRAGDIILDVAGQRATVTKTTRLGNGPKYQILTDRGEFTRGAIHRVPLVSAKT